MICFVCLFDLILYVPSKIFQLNRNGSSWVEPVLSKDKCVLLKDHNAVIPVRLEPAALRSRVKHSTTEPLGSRQNDDCRPQYYVYSRDRKQCFGNRKHIFKKNCIQDRRLPGVNAQEYPPISAY